MSRSENGLLPPSTRGKNVSSIHFLITINRYGGIVEKIPVSDYLYYKIKGGWFT